MVTVKDLADIWRSVRALWDFAGGFSDVCRYFSCPGGRFGPVQWLDIV